MSYLTDFQKKKTTAIISASSKNQKMTLGFFLTEKGKIIYLLMALKLPIMFVTGVVQFTVLSSSTSEFSFQIYVLITEIVHNSNTPPNVRSVNKTLNFGANSLNLSAFNLPY